MTERDKEERLFASDLNSYALVCGLINRLVRTLDLDGDDDGYDPEERATILLREIAPMLENAAKAMQRGVRPVTSEERDDLVDRVKLMLPVLWGPSREQEVAAKYSKLARRPEDGRPII